MRTLVYCVATFVASSAAAETAAEVLALVDEGLTKSNDQYLVYEMISKERGKAEKRLLLEATVKGKHWRRVEFLEPANIKGMRLLVRSPSQMYIYLPAFRKVRRVASHVQDQGFMGTAFDYDEISLAIFGEVFEPESVEDLGDHWSLLLKRREGQRFRHAKLKLKIRKAPTAQPVELLYMNEAGKVLKTETRSEFVCEGDFCTPKKVEMVDHTRGDLVTLMTLRKTKFNAGVPDSFFTVRALQRGN